MRFGRATKRPHFGTAEVLDMQMFAGFPKWRFAARLSRPNDRLKSGTKRKQTIHRV
jgi:hypothetical protein